ncbi:DUF2239 family protein [Morganella morganii]|nr:DUF2239 family protein [Morganella morganii]MCU6353618.1 DUF2239 family protein [Morganella morganii]
MMNKTLTVFTQNRKIAAGSLADVIRTIKALPVTPEALFIFDDQTGTRLEIDFSGEANAVYASAVQTYPEFHDNSASENTPEIKQRGRPKLGVISKEVTLLPRQWEWLASQRGGASATLRRLVDEAKKATTAVEQQRKIIESAYKFLSEMAGNLPDYDECLRALFANDAATFEKLTRTWPQDIREHAIKMAFNQ